MANLGKMIVKLNDSAINRQRCFSLESGADWPVGQFGRMPEEPAVRREKVREVMETFAFLSISAH